MLHPDAGLIEDLRKLSADGRIIPFIGAGFSKPFGLPSWRQLIEFMARDLDFDPDIFLCQGTYPQLADFFLIKNGNERTELVEQLRRWFNDDEIDVAHSRPHQLLAALDAPVHYTTNYDNILEKSLSNFGKDVVTVVRGTEAQRMSGGVSQVVKFHGDLSRPDSLIITEQDYFRRLSLDSPLDIKLRSDLLNRSLLFFGYSFEDINMRLLWYKLREIWAGGSTPMVDQPPSYYVGFGIGEVQRKILRQRFNIIPIELNPSDKSDSISEFLELLL